MSTSILVVDPSPRAERLDEELPDELGPIVSRPEMPSSLGDLDGAGVVLSLVLSLDAVEAYPTSVVRSVKQQWPWVSLVLVDGPDSARMTTVAMKAGAQDYLVRDQSSAENVATALVEAHRQRSFARQGNPAIQPVGEGKLIGTSSAMQSVFERIGVARDHRLNVLLHGEPGTGRTLTARAIHAQSTPGGAPFVTIDGRCLTPAQARELFLGEPSPETARRDASSSAPTVSPMVIQQLTGGTVVLDHVDDMDTEAQDVLVHVLETRSYSAPASSSGHDAGPRFIGITSTPPPKSFRTDLYYQLAELPIRLPPLRERAGDVVPLARHFLRAHEPPEEPPNEAPDGKSAWSLSDDARSALREHPWPGNVLQLKNVVDRAVRVASPPVIGDDDLILPHPSAVAAERPPERDERGAHSTGSGRPVSRRNADARASGSPAGAASPPNGSPEALAGGGSAALHFEGGEDSIPSMEELKKQAVKHAYEMYDGDVDRAAVALDIGRSTMYRMLDRYDLKEE
jgi:DNA-binding NtrC family response regulator